MPRLKISALISVICLMSMIVYGVMGFSQTPQPTVRLTTDPAISSSYPQGVAQLTPFEAEATTNKPPARLTLQAVDASGQLLENANIHLQILTPSKTPWFTTDFPIVEGTTLLVMDATAPKGELTLQQVFPIRGTYQLLAKVTPQTANSFAPFEQTLTLSIPENWVKYQNFALLVAILLAVGIGGGWVIGGRQPIQSGEIAPQQVRLLLSGAIGVAIVALLFVNISAEIAQSGMSMPMSHMTKAAPLVDKPDRMQSQGIDVRLSGDTNATVGKLAQFQVAVIDLKTKQPVKDVILNIKATQLENNWVAFAYQGVPDAMGQLTWQQQLFDGAPHKIEVEVAPAPNSNRKFQPFTVAQTIDVEGVAPPLLVRLISLSYLVGVVGVGLVLGFRLQRQRIRFATRA
ncbi:hypothetical protein [Phormidesmis priestleyi]